MDRMVSDVLKTPVIGQDDPQWASWSDDALLDLPMCDLHVGLKGGFLEQPIVELTHELERRGLLFRPHFWLSNEWFTPDGVPGIAVPFYLAHPRLAKLNKLKCWKWKVGPRNGACASFATKPAMQSKMPTNSAGAKHASTFSASLLNGTRMYYSPRPYSRSFVRHLDLWYRRAIRMKTLRKPSRSG